MPRDKTAVRHSGVQHQVVAEESERLASPMSLDRSPSPRRGGGWSSPGLTSPYEDGGHGRARSPAKGYGELRAGGAGGVTWASAKANSARVNGSPAGAYQQSQNQGFFGRHYRKLSESLPYFAHGGQEDRYAGKEKLGRGRPGWRGREGWGGWRELPRRMGRLLSRRRRSLALVLLLLGALLLWSHQREYTGVCGPATGLTVRCSPAILLAESLLPRRRQQVRADPRREPRRRRDGMEGPARMGDRA